VGEEVLLFKNAMMSIDMARFLADNFMAQKAL
jgi:hypothetical protein